MALVATETPERARLILAELVHLARTQQIGWQPQLNTPYVNTVAVQNQPVFPGDLAVEERLASIMRWNALAMVVRANQADMASWAGTSPAMPARRICLSGFNHFFRAREGWARAAPGRPGVLPAAQRAGRVRRAFLEGRLSEQDLMHYRRKSPRPPPGAGPVQLPAPVADA